MDRTEKAFDFAQETTKQVITLSTGIVALSVTFLKDVFGGSQTEFQVGLLITAWIAYLISIAAGIATLLSLTGSLGSSKEDSPSIFGRTIQLMAITQLLLFVGATGLIVWYGVLSL